MLGAIRSNKPPQPTARREDPRSFEAAAPAAPWQNARSLDGAALDGVLTMTMDLNESVAQAMETDVRLLPLLPELLADLWELGPSAEQVVAALESVGVAPDSTVLDLACGKGAVAVALAEQLGVRIEGIDAVQPFLQDARALATE
jgi:2-polyprenyl-3-methyl-5-hydroxy-6-metoxy-1,4-benzoquinol methylase